MSSSEADYEFQDRESALDKIENYRTRLENLQTKLHDAKTLAFQRWPSLREEFSESDDGPSEAPRPDTREVVERVTTNQNYIQLWQSLKVR